MPPPPSNRLIVPQSAPWRPEADAAPPPQWVWYRPQSDGCRCTPPHPNAHRGYQQPRLDGLLLPLKMELNAVTALHISQQAAGWDYHATGREGARISGSQQCPRCPPQIPQHVLASSIVVHQTAGALMGNLDAHTAQLLCRVDNNSRSTHTAHPSASRHSPAPAPAAPRLHSGSPCTCPASIQAPTVSSRAPPPEGAASPPGW